VLLLGLPAAVGLVVLAEPLMASLFLSEEFLATDVRLAALSLMAYAAGLPAFMAIKVLAPGYFARQDAHTPARLGLIALAVNLGLSLLLMGPLGHAGLALGTSIAAVLNAILLLWGLLQGGAYRPGAGWVRILVQGLGSVLVMGALLAWGAGGMETWLAATATERLGRLLLWILAGGAVYLLSLLALGVRPRHFQEGVPDA
jgi:putative peptidoglycan lipid II flippase